MKKEIIQKISKALNSLYFVKWDRFVDLIALDNCIKIYGWIERTDGKQDYVQLEYYTKDHPCYEGFGFTTSSSRYTHEISEILTGSTGGDHRDCERVENTFKTVKHVIKLKDTLSKKYLIKYQLEDEAPESMVMIGTSEKMAIENLKEKIAKDLVSMGLEKDESIEHAGTLSVIEISKV